jgi:hypothetical protein
MSAVNARRAISTYLSLAIVPVFEEYFANPPVHISGEQFRGPGDSADAES